MAGDGWEPLHRPAPRWRPAPTPGSLRRRNGADLPVRPGRAAIEPYATIVGPGATRAGSCGQRAQARGRRHVVLFASMPGSLVAVDAAILLPPAAQEVVARLNAQLAGPPDGFRFDGGHLPHVTLAQQFVPAADSAPGGRRGRRRAGVVPAADARGRTSRLQRTDHVARPRGDGIDRRHPLAPDGSSRDLRHDRRRRGRVRRRRRAAPRAGRRMGHAVPDRRRYASFQPHVTLGVGVLDTPAPAFEFEADQVALCHLGRFCTCRRVGGFVDARGAVRLMTLVIGLLAAVGLAIASYLHGRRVSLDEAGRALDPRVLPAGGTDLRLGRLHAERTCTRPSQLAARPGLLRRAAPWGRRRLAHRPAALAGLTLRPASSPSASART